MACGGADRIDAAIFLDEAEAGQPELVDLGLLLRRQLALDADEAAAGFSRLRKLSTLTSGSTLATCSASSSMSMTRFGSA